MATISLSGNQGTQTMDHITNQYSVDGACLVTNGSTISNTVGAGQNPMIYSGAYAYWSSGTSGIFNLVASASNRFQFQPSGVSTTWNVNFPSTYRYLGTYAGSGAWTLQYVDAHYITFYFSGSGGPSVQDATILYGCTGTTGGFYLPTSGGAPTFNNLAIYYNAVGFSLNGAGNRTMTGLKAIGCTTGMVFGTFGTSGVNTITNALFAYCGACVTGTPASTSSFTRFVMCPYRTGAWSSALASPNTWTLSQFYVGGSPTATTEFYNNGTAVPSISNSVFMAWSIEAVGALVYNWGTSNCDILGPGTGSYAPKLDGTSSNDFIANYSNTGPLLPHLDDWALAAYYVDGTINATTSTLTPKGFHLLDSNRLTAAAAPNMPPTWSGVSDSTVGGVVTIIGTSGIEAKSRVLLRASSGGATILATPWKYAGFLSLNSGSDFTLPVTSHSHDISESILQPGATYPYVLEGIDPLGRRFLSTESSFAVTGQDLPAIGNVRDTDTLLGVPGTLLSDKILKSNATGDGAGNYNDDNLGIGNVRPVAFGIGLTGDLSNLVATDAAYVSLENGRNNDNGTVAADIASGKSVKIRNVTTDGTAIFGGGGIPGFGGRFARRA